MRGKDYVDYSVPLLLQYFLTGFIGGGYDGIDIFLCLFGLDF